MSGRQSKAWKDLERRHAKRFKDGVRLWRPDYSESIPDGECESDVWDTKYRQRVHAVELFLEAEQKYRGYAAGRRFHLCFHAARRQGDFVLVRAEDYAALVEGARGL